MTLADEKDATKGRDPEIGWCIALLTYYAYALYILIGHIRDFTARITGISRYTNARIRKGYSTLLKSWESFYTRRLYHRIQDCWGRPISSAPAAHFKVLERVSFNNNTTLETTGATIDCLNLGSYNYLGFADDWKETCRDEVLSCLEKWPISTCSSRMDLGSTKIHEELEKIVAKFVGKEDAVVYTMGYGTNTTTIPALAGGQGTLIVSDSQNHLSIVNGCRSTSASTRVFRHNDTKHLEEILQEAIVNGQPRHHRPWRKIIVMVEGIYSMEGSICKLKEIVAICKKYKAYIYVDEAHSIGALGKTGRGVCEHSGVDPKDVDVLMGTFTKSFSGMGGYIAASKEIIAHIRAQSSGFLYHCAMSPVVAAQVLRAFKVITGEDGTDYGAKKLARLRENSNYFRKAMVDIGLHVYGSYDSPIIPVMLYMPCKLHAFSRECLKRGLAVVVVGFPATSVVLSRSRFCISAGHTREDLDFAISVIKEVADLLCIKYSRNFFGA